MLTLSDIAFIDGALLLIVFVLTIIVLSRNNQKDHYAETIRDELASVLADASLALTARRSRQTASFVTQFDRMAQELLTEMRQERARVGELASRKEKEVGDLTTMTRDFMTSTQGMLAAVQSLQHVPQQLGRIMTALTSSFQQLTDQHKEQQQEFTTATRQATTQLQQLADEYRTMSMDMQMMSTNLQATGTSLQTMGTDLQTMGADLRDSIDTTRKTSTQSAQAMSDMRTVAGNLVAAQTEFLAALGHERGMLEKSTQSMNTTIQALQQTQQSLEQRIDILAQTLQQMTSQQQEMGTDLRASLDTLQTAVADIASASREMQAALLAAREDS
jgi:predicted  nucleic acid-binding Zn-ribbon protein